LLAAQKAAVANGFHRRIAAQFAGALGEMVSNIPARLRRASPHSGQGATDLSSWSPIAE
jgi:hypothetical protein